MSEQKPGQSEGLESAESDQPIEAVPEGPVTIEKLYGLITKQNNAILLLTGKLVETTTKLEGLEEHQDTTDKVIIEVAKKAAGGGGGVGGGKGANLLAQIMPYLTQPRGSGPLEKIAQGMFIRQMSFSALMTDQLAKKQFGDAYKSMVKEMESDLYGEKGEGSKST